MSGALTMRVKAFLREADMPPSAFGRDVAGDPRLVTDLRNGREVRRKLAERIERYMTDWRADYAAGRVQRVGDRRRSRD